MKTLKRILILTSIIFLFKIPVYAEEIDYCGLQKRYNYFEPLNTNNYCTLGGTYYGYTNSIYGTIVDFQMYGINFRYGNNDSSLLYYYVIYNKEYDIYLIRFNSSSSSTITSNVNAYYGLFSSEELSIQNAVNGYYPTFTSNDKTIYMYQNTKISSSYADIENWCLITTNMSYISISDKNMLENECVSEEPTPDPDPPTPEPEPILYLDYIYVPNYTEGQCIEIIDKDTIRVFENEETLNYTDYYINSHYLSKQGQVEQEYVKNCSSLLFTDKRYYGNDFPQILFLFLSLVILSALFLYKLFKVFRKR